MSFCLSAVRRLWVAWPPFRVMTRRRAKQAVELAMRSASRQGVTKAAAAPRPNGITTIVDSHARAVSICYIRRNPPRACGAVGSALPWHGRGREFESHQVHQNFANSLTNSDGHSGLGGNIPD